MAIVGEDESVKTGSALIITASRASLAFRIRVTPANLASSCLVVGISVGHQGMM
jgi:D-alanine-D-alanine ligase-like ATP-grasp enzyme